MLPQPRLRRMKAAEIRERFLSFFEERDHLRVPSASLVPPSLRPLGAADHRRDAALQALLPRRGGATVAAAHLLPEGVSHHRHRGGGPHPPPPHVLRDARQLLGGRLLQGARRGAGARAVHAGLRASLRADLDHRVRRRRGPRPGCGRGGDRVLAGRGRARRADRAPRARGQLLAVGADRSVRALLGAVSGPRAGVRLRRRPARGRHRALPRVLEPGVHAVRPGRRRLAHAAAEQEHRHRHGPRPHGGDPPGRGVGVRDRPAPAAGRAGRGAVGAHVRPGRGRPRARCASSRTTGAPRPSCSPTAWCRRTRTAGTSCAGSCAGRCTRAACSGSRRACSRGWPSAPSR